jgi:hypothetical protein
MKGGLHLLVAAALLGGVASTSPVCADEGIYSSFDFLFLSPKFNDVEFGNIFYFPGVGEVESLAGTTGADLDFAHRLAVGYEGDLGGGAQVRWFSYDNDSTYSGVAEDEDDGPTPLDGFLNIDLDTIDVELTQSCSLGVWDWMGMAGVRYGRVSVRESDIDWSVFDDSVWFGSSGVKFEGAGPTVGVQGTRNVIWEELSIFTAARTALLYGDAEQWNPWRVGGVTTINDEFVQTYEVQMGAQCEFEHENYDCLLGIFWEAQRYDSSLLGDVSLHGFGVRTGFEY